MTSGKYHRTTISLLCTIQQIYSLNTYNSVTVDNQTRHFGLEVHFASTSYYRLAHIFNHLWQLVSANVRMSVGKN